MQLLKLAALDTEDLEVLSAHLQDAVMRVGDVAYVPGQNRFAMVLNRFDWERASEGRGGKKRYERRRSALRFDRVLGAQIQGIRQSARNAVLELLAIQFEATDEPEGYVTLVFAGDAAIRLHVECIEAEMKDLGPVWRAQSKPEHGEEAD
jgi:hypothetical protein